MITTDQPMAPGEKVIVHRQPHDSNNTIKIKQAALFPGKIIVNLERTGTRNYTANQGSDMKNPHTMGANWIHQFSHCKYTSQKVLWVTCFIDCIHTLIIVLLQEVHAII